MHFILNTDKNKEQKTVISVKSEKLKVKNEELFKV